MFCWLNQKLISSRVDVGGELSPRLHRHVAGCGRCRVHYSEQRDIAQRLTATHAGQREAPPFLHGGIMAALRREEVEPQRNQMFPRWAMTAGIALAAVLALWLVWNPDDALERQRLTVTTTQATSSPGMVAEVFPSVPSFNFDRISENLEQPFAEEAGALVADAKAALQLLAQNFVPTGPPQDTRPGTER